MFILYFAQRLCAMAQVIKKIWRLISFLGVEQVSEIVTDELKIRIFFNRCIFVGFFTLLGTVISTIPFIGNYAYLNLINCLAIVIALLLHKKGYFNVSKRIVVYSLFTVGLFLSAISGPDYLFHMGIITVLIFAWVLFNPKKEQFELILFFILSISIYLMGELNIFNAPDFSQYPETETTRIANLIGYTSVVLIFISFIRRLNIQNEQKLSEALVSKELLITEVLIKTKSLEERSDVLEDEISERTSELLKQKEALESKNAEKEILLKEIHHRVKNNLQIIVSLLNLQSRNFDDPDVIDALNETQNRIISMSLVHQRMYQTSDFVAVEFKDYTDLLIDNIQILFADKEKQIKQFNEIPGEFKIDIERAIPLGLIINEMVTNSFKHAFISDGDTNEIQINLEKEDQRFILKYKDNGVGFPDNFNVSTAETLGIQLIVALVEQIDGELSFHNKDGAVYEVMLPL